VFLKTACFAGKDQGRLLGELFFDAREVI